MKTIALIIFVFLQIAATFGQDIESDIQLLFNAQANADNIEQASLKVFSPTHNLNISCAYPLENTLDSTGFPRPFYTASIGKMFTAVSMAILKDKGQLDFEDLISEYLSDDIMKGLHVINDHSYANKITIAHLLQHKSGLADYFEDQTFTGQPKVIDALFIYPNKIWTPLELLQFYKNNLTSKFIPGTDYHYTDTEYLLLGLIIERISGKPLHEFFMSEIFKPLDLTNTYLNLKSTPLKKTGEMMKVMVGDMDISKYKSLSADWAGGGIVSTNSDLITFFLGLMNERLITSESLKQMQNWTKESIGMEYGFGLRRITFKELSPNWRNMVVVGHSGVTGAFLYYSPELDTYISGSLNQVNANKESTQLMHDILSIIKTKD